MGKSLIIYSNVPTFKEWPTNFKMLFQAVEEEWVTSSDSLRVSDPPNMEQSSKSRNIGIEAILSALTNRNVLPIRLQNAILGYMRW